MTDASAKSRHWRRVFFAFIYQLLAPMIVFWTKRTRIELFDRLKDLKSKDIELRSEGPGVLRILEVGLGPGSNLPFYPKGTRLITVDPNPYFSKSVRDNIKRNSHIQIEKHIVAYGEDMSEIPDCSIDVVVGTYLLCSVNDHNQVMKEFHRVLVPGGKYFFYEHCGFPNSVVRWIQYLAQPIWSILFHTCVLTAPGYKSIQSSKLTVEYVRSFYLYRSCIFMWPHIMGVAVK